MDQSVEPLLTSRRWTWLWIALLAAIFLVIFQHNTARFPYYAIADMEQITALDVLLIQGGQLPDQMTHPTAGMYLLISFSQWFGWLIGLLHMRDYKEIYSWANPLLGVAELIEFLRAHLAFLALGSALLFTGALAIITRGGSLFVVFVFLCFVNSRSLTYHTILFRTDIFALFYASCSLFMAAAALSSNKRPQSFVLATGSGLLAALALTSKIQILPTIAAIPLFAFLMILRDSSLSVFSKISQRTNRTIGSVSIGLYVTFLLLAFFQTLPENYYHYRSYSVTLFSVIVGLAIVFPMALIQFFQQKDSIAYRFGSFANFMGLGVVLSIPLLVFTFSNPSIGATFAISVAKITFLGTPDLVFGSAASFWHQFTSAPILFLVPAAILCVLALSEQQRSSYAEIAVLGLVFFLCILSAAVFNRGILGSDIIFTEPLCVFLSGVLLHTLWRERMFSRIAAMGFAALLAFNLMIHGRPAAMVDAQLTSPSYFNESRQLMTYFGRGNQGLFEGNFQRLFVKDDDGRVIPTASRDAIFEEAASHREIVSQLEFSLPNVRVDRSRIGVVAEGLKPYGQKRPTVTFTNVGNDAKGAISYAPPAASSAGGANNISEILSWFGVHSIDRDALLRLHPENIRTRSDLSVFVLIPADIKGEFGVVEEPAEIRVGDQDYVALPVPSNPSPAFLSKLGTIDHRIVVLKRRHI